MILALKFSLLQGFTPLHLAAQSGHDNAILQLIREYGTVLITIAT